MEFNVFGGGLVHRSIDPCTFTCSQLLLEACRPTLAAHFLSLHLYINMHIMKEHVLHVVVNECSHRLPCTDDGSLNRHSATTNSPSVALTSVNLQVYLLRYTQCINCRMHGDNVRMDNA